MLSFVPKFYGVKERGETPYLVLQNLLHECKAPAFMDLKVGKSLHYREDPLREGVYNLLGLFIHGVSSSFLKLKNRVNEYRGRQVTIDDFDAIIRLFFRMMGPSQEVVDRIKNMIKVVKSMDGVRFYGTSLFIAFDEDETSSFKPSLHFIDFERAKVDAESDGSACLSAEEVQKVFKTGQVAQRVVNEPEKVQGTGGGPSSVPPRNDTDQQAVDTSLLQETGPDLYILRSLKHLLGIVQEEWSQEEHVRFNPGYNPHVIWRQSRQPKDDGIIPSQTPLPRRPIFTYLVRHGERYDYTDVSWGKQAAYPHDSHLSPIGETQAQDLADRLANARPAMIVASPFQRALLSAIPLARRLRIPVCVEPGLAEFLCKDTRTKIPGFFSSEVSISPWVDINYKPFWPQLKLESWSEMRQRVAVTASHLIKQCQEMGGDLIICSHRSTLTAVFEWLDVSAHPNARLEYGALAVLARKDWELLEEDVVPKDDSRFKIQEGDSEQAKKEKIAASEYGAWSAITFNEVQHLRNHIQSPSSNPFRHIEGYYEDLSWTNYKKAPVVPLTPPFSRNPPSTSTPPTGDAAKGN